MYFILTVLCSYSMHVLIAVFDRVICTTPDAHLRCLSFCKKKVVTF